MVKPWLLYSLEVFTCPQSVTRVIVIVPLCYWHMMEGIFQLWLPWKHQIQLFLVCIYFIIIKPYVFYDWLQIKSLNSGAIPLVDSNGELLPIQFPVDPGENDHSPDKNQELSFTDSLSLLNSYLDIVKLDPQVFIMIGISNCT